MTDQFDPTLLHPSLTSTRVREAVERRRSSLDDPGFCLECGHEQSGVEPDGRNIECEACGEETVMGCEELLDELGVYVPDGERPVPDDTPSLDDSFHRHEREID